MAEHDNVLLLAGIRNPAKIREAFDLIIGLGLKMMDANEGSLLIYQKEQRMLQFAATVGTSSSSETLVGKTVPIGKGITGMAALTGEVQTASRSEGNLLSVPEDGSPNSVIAAPILLDDELIGVITAVKFDNGKAFSSQDCQIFAMLAQLGAVIISQEQMISNYSSESINSLTEQDATEMQIARQALALAKKHPGKEQKVLQVLSLLTDLKS